jgi:hypothetical protein
LLIAWSIVSVIAWGYAFACLADAVKESHQLLEDRAQESWADTVHWIVTEYCARPIRDGFKSVLLALLIVGLGIAVSKKRGAHK